MTVDTAGSLSISDTTIWTLPAAGYLAVDATTNDNTTTSGVIDLNVETSTDNNTGINLYYTSLDDDAADTLFGFKTYLDIAEDATANDIVYGHSIEIDQADTGGGSIYGMRIQAVDAGAGVVTAGLLIDNAQSSDIDMTDGILIQATTDGSMPDAIDVSDAEITNALNVGANTIIGTTGAITYSGATTWSSTAGDLTIASSDTGDGGSYDLILQAGNSVTSAGADGNDIAIETEDDFLVETKDDMDMDIAGSFILTAADAAGSAITLTTSNGAGGIDIDPGTGGIDVDLDATGVFAIDGDLVAIGSTGADGNVAVDDGDLYVVGVLEVDSELELDGTFDLDSTGTVDGSSLTGDLFTITGSVAATNDGVDALAVSHTLTDSDASAGINLTVTNVDDGTAPDTFYGMLMTIDDNSTSADDTAYGLYIDNPDSGGADADLATDAFIVLDNSDDTVLVADGILFTSAGGAITDAIDASDTNITNALNVGANTITGGEAIIDFTDFDLSADGLITIANDADGVGLTIAPDAATTTAIDVTDTDITNAISVGANTIAGTTAVIDFTDFDVDADGKVTLAPDTAGDALAINFGAAQALQAIVIDAATNDSTAADGIINLTVDTTTDNAEAIYIDYEITDDNSSGTHSVINVASTMTSNDGDAFYGIQVADLGGSPGGGNEYAIYQAGNSWDYGLYVTDDAYFGDNVSVTDDLAIEGILDLGSLDTFGADDTSPDVSGGIYFSNGDNTAEQVIESFDNGVAGQTIYVKVVTDAQGEITFDCDDTEAGANNLNCGTTDVVMDNGDHTVWIYDGTSWNLLAFVDVSVDNSGGADIAEWMKSDQDLSPGTVVVSHPSKAEYVVSSGKGYDIRAVGVVADIEGVLGDLTPGLLLGNEADGTPVTLAGRVWAKFDSQNGDVGPGDPLTSAPDGKLMKAVKAGPTVGKALSTGVNGYVITLLDMGWFDPIFLAEEEGDEVATLALEEEGEVLAATSEGEILALGGSLEKDETLQVSLIEEMAGLRVLENAEIVGTLKVEKAALFEGTIEVSGRLYVAGDLEIGGALIQEFTAGGELSAGDVVYISGANTVNKASSASEASLPAIGLAVSETQAGENVKVAVAGTVKGLSGLSAGRIYYLGSWGAMTAVEPKELIQVIGVARSENEFLVMPGLDYRVVEVAEVEEEIVEEEVEESTEATEETMESNLPEPSTAPSVEPSPSPEPEPESESKSESGSEGPSSSPSPTESPLPAESPSEEPSPSPAD